MQVLQKWGNFTKGELFNISKGQGCALMKNVEEGKVFTVTGACVLKDEAVSAESGEVKEKQILHIRTDEAVYTTESPTIIETFIDAVDFMEDYKLKFKLLRQKSKNGRLFMDLELLTEE